MGRRKIPIQQITDPKLRLITFHKRKKGLIKKAAEMSLLCNVNLVLIFEDGFENLIQFSKNRFTSMDAFLKECKYNNVLKLTADEYPSFEKMTRYRNTVSVEGQEKISYEDEMIEKDHSHDSDSDDEFIYFNKNDAPKEDSNRYSNKQSKSKKNRDQSPNCKESPGDLYNDQTSTLVKNETEAEDPNLKSEYAEFTPPQPCPSESQKLDLTKMMASDQIGETMRVAGQRGVEYMRQFNTTYGDHQYLSAAASSLNNYPNAMGNLIAAPMNQMFPYAGNNNNNMAIKNQKMINYLMSSKDRPMYSQIFPPKEAVTDLNNPPVHNNRELGRSPNFINQNSLYFDRQVLTSSSVNNERMLHTMLRKHQEVPNSAVYQNYAQAQGEENIKMEEHNFYGGNFESALRNDPEKIKKKIKTD